MTLPKFLDATKLPSINPVVEPDENKLKAESFEMNSREHLIWEQLNFLVEHAVNTIFDDRAYKDEWKNHLSGLLSEELGDLLTLVEPPTQQEMLEVLVKPDAMMALQSHIKIGFDESLEHLQQIPFISTLIYDFPEDNEEQSGSAKASV